MSRNEEIVREACRVIWSEGQIDRVQDYYAEEFVADYPLTNWGSGLDGVRALAADVRIGLPDYHEEIKLLLDAVGCCWMLLDAGEYIVVELLFHGTHTGPMAGIAATGKAVSFRDVTILKLKNGKIIEQRGLSDHVSLFQQLGITTIPSASVDAVATSE